MDVGPTFFGLEHDVASQHAIDAGARLLLSVIEQLAKQLGMLGGAAVPEHGSVQTMAKSRRGGILQPLGDFVRRQILSHVVVIFIVGVAEFLVGIVGDLHIRIVQVIKEEAQARGDILVFYRQGALKILDDVAVTFDLEAAVRIDLALEHVAENQKFARGFVGGNVARQSDDFLVSEDVVFLDDGFNLQIGAALVQTVGV